MMNSLRLRCSKYPKRCLVLSLLAILVILLLLFLINEKNWRPLKGKPSWDAEANYSPTRAQWAIDQNLETRWSSHVSMSSGMYFRVSLKTPVIVNGVVLHAGKDGQGQPHEWLLKISSDGTHWRALVPIRHVYYRDMLAIFFPPVRLRSLHIQQTSINPTQTPWIIHELDLLQPVVPWQLSRSTFISILIGWGLIFLSVLMFLSHQMLPGWPPPKVPLYLASTVLLIIFWGVSWGLRMASLEQYALSPESISFLAAMDLRKMDHLTWLKQYAEMTVTAPSWLYLFSTRLISQATLEVRSAFACMPSLFGIGLGMLILTFYKSIAGTVHSKSSASHSGHVRWIFWESCMAAILVSLSGLSIWMSRQGNLSVILLFWIIAYLLIAYRFLYQQGSVFWLAALALILFLGFSFHSVFALLPVIIGIISGFALGFPFSDLKDTTTSRRQSILRWLLFCSSGLPFVMFWILFSPGRAVLPEFSLQRPIFSNLGQGLEYMGFTGWVSVLWWGATLLGLQQFIRRHQRGEVFFYSITFLFALLVNGFPSRPQLSFLVLSLLLLLLCAKGLARICAWGTEPFTLHHPRVQDALVLTVLLLTGGYFGGFSANSVITNVPHFPSAASLVQIRTQEQNFTDQLHTLRANSDPCALIGTLDPVLAEYAPITYGITPDFARFTEIWQQAAQGHFWTYLLMSKTSAHYTSAEVLDFFQQYYRDHAQSRNSVLYYLRDRFHKVPQRFFAEDVISETGRLIENETLAKDQSPARKTVLAATPDDAPGLLMFWPIVRICSSSPHEVQFALWSEGGRDDEVVAVLEVIADTHNILARRELTARDFHDASTYQLFTVPFTLPDDNPAYQMKRVQFLIHVTGKAEVRLHYLDIIPEPQSSVDPNGWDRTSS